MKERRFREDALNKVEKHFEALSKKYLKITGKTYEFEIKEDGTEKVFAGRRYDPFKGCVVNHYINAKMFIVEFDDEVFGLGEEFIGMVDHTERPVLVKCLNDDHKDFLNELKKDSLFKCSGCGSKRLRKYTFVTKGKDGNLKTYGSKCIREATGMNPSFFNSWVSKAPFWGDDYDGYGYRIKSEYWNVRRFIAIAGLMSIEDGYKKTSEEHPTKEAAINCYHAMENPPRNPYEYRRWKKDAAEVSKNMNRIKVDECIEYWKAETTEFGKNIAELIEAERVTVGHLGILAYAYEGYRRHIKRKEAAEAEAKDTTPSVWLGEIKERLEITIKEADYRLFSSDWGYYTVITMKDLNDNTVKTITSSEKITDFIDDWKIDDMNKKPFLIKGTVKKHGEWKGRKETVLSRVTVIG